MVKGAKSDKAAEMVARHVANSNLVKTMIAGGDPNWGRVASSIGASGVDIKSDKVSIYFGKALVMKSGAGTKCSKKRLKGIFNKKEIEITIDLHVGSSFCKMWTCDLTDEYVRINSEYST